MDANQHSAGQDRIATFLEAELAREGEAVERIETHGAIVLLAGARALKLKRAVRFPFLDFSTPDRRRDACRAEVELNRRTAPDLYLGVAAVISRADGSLALTEPREEASSTAHVVDWVVVMRRFPHEALFDRMAETGGLTGHHMRALAEAIAAFHDEAEPRTDAGGADDLRDVAQGIMAQLRLYPAVFPADRLKRLEALLGSSLDRGKALQDRRRDAGYVRHCHGDLHLRNVVLWEGRPTPFDCIEFDPRYAVTDVLYDVAFLLMDLEHRRLRPLANVFLNRYVELSGDLAGLCLLPPFLAMRAAIRAHLTLAAAHQTTGSLSEAVTAEAISYLDLALALLAPPAPRLIAIGGLSGTGKTTLARDLAPLIGPAPGAVILRSDVLRKRLLGLEEATRLEADGYSEAVTSRVYAEIAGRAGLALESHHAVICDAVYARPDQRAAIEAIAATADRPFSGLWLVADQETQLNRVTHRTGDASDAQADTVRRQAAYDIGEMSWDIIPANGRPDEVAAIARRVISSSA